MKISRRKQVTGTTRVGKTSKAKPRAKVQESVQAPAEAADVNLSEAVHEVESVRKALAAMPDVRVDKVDALKPVVDEGSYHVDSKVIAKKVVDTSLRESAQLKRPRKK